MHDKYTATVKSLDETYDAKTPRDKYEHISEFQDFKRRVWDINHQNQPPPASWFGTDTVEDDDIVVDQEIQSLNCPITLTLLENPVRNATCPHVYSRAAIVELIRHGRGQIKCPVAGCGANVTEKQLKEDKVMARKIREEKAREEERVATARQDALEVSEGMSDVIYEDIKAE